MVARLALGMHEASILCACFVYRLRCGSPAALRNAGIFTGTYQMWKGGESLYKGALLTFLDSVLTEALQKVCLTQRDALVLDPRAGRMGEGRGAGVRLFFFDVVVGFVVASFVSSFTVIAEITRLLYDIKNKLWMPASPQSCEKMLQTVDIGDLVESLFSNTNNGGSLSNLFCRFDVLFGWIAGVPSCGCVLD